MPGETELRGGHQHLMAEAPLQCRVGWCPRISRTPLELEISAPFAFSDTTAEHGRVLVPHG